MDLAIMEKATKRKRYCQCGCEDPEAILTAMENQLADQISFIQEVKKNVSKFYCETHQEWKQVMSGDLDCESCLVEHFHAGDEGAEVFYE